MAELSSFHDVRFPVAISFGATGGPEHRNEIVRLTSGAEKRNARFAQSRRRFDAGTGLRSLSDLHDVIAFFEARRGSLHAFRFTDPFDNLSCNPDEAPAATDQLIGTGDGTANAFQLSKTYGSGVDAYVRSITKPVDGTILVAVDTVSQAIGTDVTVDHLTGTLTFLPGAIPAAGAAVSAGFSFDVPVRFDTEQISASISSFKAGQIPAIPLIEVRS